MVNTSAGDNIEESDYANNADSVEFTIEEPAYVPTYTVHRDGSSVATDVAVSEYQDTGLTNGIEYCYTVTQNMEDGTVSGESDQACATPTAGAGGGTCDDPIAAVVGSNDGSGSDQWFHYTATTDGLITISSQNAAGDAAWDTDLYVLDACEGLVVASNDDCCGYYGPSTVEFASVSGVDLSLIHI